jgi:hypothetical protein
VVDQYFEFLKGGSCSIKSNITKVESIESEGDNFTKIESTKLVEEDGSTEPEAEVVSNEERVTQQKSIRAFLVQFNQGRRYPVEMASL